MEKATPSRSTKNKPRLHEGHTGKPRTQESPESTQERGLEEVERKQTKEQK